MSVPTQERIQLLIQWTLGGSFPGGKLAKAATVHLHFLKNKYHNKLRYGNFLEVTVEVCPMSVFPVSKHKLRKSLLRTLYFKLYINNHLLYRICFACKKLHVSSCVATEHVSKF
jgi:hypothetical protein